MQPVPTERLTVAADRRQVTVMFCDLVGSTPLSEQLDPEEWRDVLGAYHAACSQSIERFDGHIAKYLGDGLLVFFGYPTAHEDDAPRSLHAGLGILQEMQHLSARLKQPLTVRIGVHTGLVVAGEVGNDALDIVGTTPHIAARLQTLAQPGALVASADTCQLAPGLFTTVSLGPQTLRGVSAPIPVYRIVEEREARHPLEGTVQTGLTPLTGREQEAGLLLERWEQVQERHGQVILLSGEAGIGKSRLIQALTERAAQTSAAPALKVMTPAGGRKDSTACHSPTIGKDTHTDEVYEVLEASLYWLPDHSPLRHLECSLHPEYPEYPFFSRAGR